MKKWAQPVSATILFILFTASLSFAAGYPVKVPPFPQKVATIYKPGETPGDCDAVLKTDRLPVGDKEPAAPDLPEGLDITDVRASFTDAEGVIYLGAPDGIYRKTPDGEWTHITGKNGGLPYQDVLALDGDGKYLWVGTSIGAARWDGAEWQYLQGPQYLPDDRVTSLIAMPDGGACLETPAGVSRIEYRMMTLEEKAAHYENITRLRHVRHNLVSDSNLWIPGDISSSHTGTRDNDGLWTSMYIGAECYRYAATGDPEAKKFAHDSFQALMFLEEVNEIPGFVSRSFALPDEPHGSGEWDHLTSDGKWRWKGDTSSDEMDGHFFAYSVYYDLCAAEDEKPKIREKVSLIMDYIIDNDFYLIDLDGLPTAFGKWNPKFLNGEGIFMRGLNSLELLSYLKTTYHITGNEKYQEEYMKLIKNNDYAKNTIKQKYDHPRHSNHSDDELAFIVYYPLMKYEKHPYPLKYLLKSLARSWEIERPEKNPWFNFIYGAVMPDVKDFDVEESIWMLQRMPLDLVTWRHINTHRADIEINFHKDRFGDAQSTEILPPDERTIMKWNSNPYKLDEGGNATEEAGTPWLLPYWMGRYYGFIDG